MIDDPEARQKFAVIEREMGSLDIKFERLRAVFADTKAQLWLVHQAIAAFIAEYPDAEAAVAEAQSKLLTTGQPDSASSVTSKGE